IAVRRKAAAELALELIAGNRSAERVGVAQAAAKCGPALELHSATATSAKSCAAPSPERPAAAHRHAAPAAAGGAVRDAATTNPAAAAMALRACWGHGRQSQDRGCG